MKKRIVALLMAVIMVVAMTAGCANSQENTQGNTQGNTQESKQESTQGNTQADTQENTQENTQGDSMRLVGEGETAELSLQILSKPTDGNPDDMWFFKYYEEMTGVHMNVTAVPVNDWPDKKAITMASGTYPGIIWKGNWTTSEIAEYGADGTFLDLTDYIEYMPNYKKMMDMIEGSWKSVTCPDGGMYSLASIDPSNYRCADQTWLNTKWLENVGMEMPETLDEFYEVLKAFKEQDADGDGDSNNEIPYGGFANLSQSTVRLFMLNSFGFNIGASASSSIAQETWNNNKTVFMPLTERYKEYLEYMKRLMEEGLLDPNLYSQDMMQYEAKTLEGLCGVIGTGGTGTQLIKMIEKDWASYDRFVLGYDESSEKIALITNPVVVGRVVITDNCEDPVLAAKWIDQFYEAENAFNTLSGPIVLEYPDGTTEVQGKNVTEDPQIGGHVMVDEDGNYLNISYPFVDSDMAAYDWLCLNHPANSFFNTTVGEQYIYGQLFKGYKDNVDAYCERQRTKYEDDSYSDADRAVAYQQWRHALVGYPYKIYDKPTVYPTDEQQAWLDEYRTILEEYAAQMEAKFITGAADLDAEYDAYIEELKRKGAEELQAIYVELYGN